MFEVQFLFYDVKESGALGIVFILLYLDLIKKSEFDASLA